jgi:hypothetical protein
MTSSLAFEDHVQALPAELFNEIYDLVFALPPANQQDTIDDELIYLDGFGDMPSGVSINSSYWPPVQLQIS